MRLPFCFCGDRCFAQGSFVCPAVEASLVFAENFAIVAEFGMQPTHAGTDDLCPIAELEAD